jgi:DNA polymerase elongation subunit (family B)
MVELRGYLLDVYPNYEFNYMTSWLKLADNGTPGSCRVGAEQFSVPFEPRFYVHGTKQRLRELRRKLADYPEIRDMTPARWRIDIADPRVYDVLEVTMREYKELKPCAAMIDREGKYAEFQLFNVDLRLSQKYMFRKGVFPLAQVTLGRTLELLDDDQFSMDYTVPSLTSAELDIKVNKRGRIVTYDDPLGSVTVGDITLDDTDEAGLLMGLVETVKDMDPDIIYTMGGDSFVVPYLYHRAEMNLINDKFQLGRENDAVYSDYVPSSEQARTNARDSEPRTRPSRRKGKSYFTYGQIKYKPPFYAFKGRIHIDKLSSFMFLESGLYGLLELARLAGIPFQTMSRLSPGTAISGMQITQALRDGVLVRWKKNVPESFKSAKTLLLADRGGHIFDPFSGVHENVLEIDFASLYPNIIATKNISPETVLCECCGTDQKAPRVPATGYHVCRRRRGLIPRVIERIIQRRVVHKRRRERENDMHDQRQKVLKWVLVTCLDGDTIVPFENEGKAKFQPISKIIDKYLPEGEGILDVNNEFIVFGLTKDLKPTKVQVRKIFKFRTPEKMLCFRLRQGSEVYLTENHPCYILEDGKLKVKRADELEVGNFLPIVTEIEQSNPNRCGLHKGQLLSIEEVPPRTPFVYCFEVAEGLPGFVIEGNIFTHNCFGYTGYRNARFGRIECHESITAYGREILLDAMEVAEGMGHRVLHGIVDSLWVTTGNGNGELAGDALRESYEELCGAIAERTGIDIEFEGYYRWIVFLPNKSTGVGALNRYYGLLDSGEFKVRGIELRQRSTPKLFQFFQKDILDTLAHAGTKQELTKAVKKNCMHVIQDYAQRILSGECDVHDLVFSMRVTKQLGEYRVFNDRVAALTQLTGEGVEVHPGETVRYVILNHDTRDPNRRVRVLELLDGDEHYDRSEYLKHLFRMADSILRPFGYTEDVLKEEMKKSVQKTIG